MPAAITSPTVGLPGKRRTRLSCSTPRKSTSSPNPAEMAKSKDPNPAARGARLLPRISSVVALVALLTSSKAGKRFSSWSVPSNAIKPRRGAVATTPQPSVARTPPLSKSGPLPKISSGDPRETHEITEASPTISTCPASSVTIFDHLSGSRSGGEALSWGDCKGSTSAGGVFRSPKEAGPDSTSPPSAIPLPSVANKRRAR
mmetsp:Transcript_45543/g.91940  ORF Transcript_45543/g.91940 Transcript_45543/m.91940 type:complete len:202 (-) Transcript_45543:168-773(-)